MLYSNAMMNTLSSVPSDVTVVTMVRWNVRNHLDAKGWSNANQLSLGAGLSYPVAARVLANEPMERIEVATLERLRSAFGLRGAPWSLLEYVPDKPRSR